uniref:PWI domain-containing protein n=1 Tax=Rhabditophanes sp. KR3021 TaxID=114890 RepID=A0AC35TQ37_9BILA
MALKKSGTNQSEVTTNLESKLSTFHTQVVKPIWENVNKRNLSEQEKEKTMALIKQLLMDNLEHELTKCNVN